MIKKMTLRPCGALAFFIAGLLFVCTDVQAQSLNGTIPELRMAIDQDYFPERQSVQRVVQDFALLRQLGLRTLRTGIGWDDTNPSRGTYRWTYWANVIAAARANGLDVRPYYAYTPSWAGKTYNAPPRNAGDFAAACSVMVRSIGTSVRSFEVWNEPDNSAFWTGSALQYDVTLQDCTDAIRASRDTAAIVLGGLVNLDTDWLRRSGARAPNSHDIAAFHQYCETPWDHTTVEALMEPRAYWPAYDRLSQQRSVPVWMNEGGASTAATQGYTQFTQSSWMRRTFASLIGQPNRPLALFGFYQLRDLDPKLSKPIGDPVARTYFLHTGIFTLDGRPKLGAATYADLVHLFDGHRPQVSNDVRYVAGSGRPSNNFRQYSWQLEDGRQIVMLWDRSAWSSGDIVFHARGDAAYLHQPDGTIVRISSFNGRTLANVKLIAGAIPLLFEIR